MTPAGVCKHCFGGGLACGTCYREPIDCRHLVYEDDDDLLGTCETLVRCPFCSPDQKTTSQDRSGSTISTPPG